MTEEQVLDALHEVIDPEIGVNVVDLGLVYGIALDGRDVGVEMTMTSPLCPLRDYLHAAAEAAIRRNLPAVGAVDIRFVSEPPWHPGRMTDAARRELGWIGPESGQPPRPR